MSRDDLTRLYDYARQRAEDRDEPAAYRPVWAQIADEVEAYRAPGPWQPDPGAALFGPDDPPREPTNPEETSRE